MALLWMDGFDHYGNNADGDRSSILSKAYTVSNSNWIVASTGRFSSSSRTNAIGLYFAPNKYGTTRIYKPITPTVGTTHLICGFNLYNVAGQKNVYINSGWNGATNGVSINSSNQLKCGPNIVATLNTSTWYHIEIRIPITTSGSNKYELYLNGTTVFSSSSLSFAWANGLYFGCVFEPYNESTCFGLDDLYIMDDTGATNNARIGTEIYIPRIETQFPVDDTTNNFTPSYTPITSVTYGFENLSGANAATILSGVGTACGFSNLSQEGTQTTFFRSDNSGGVGDSRCLMLRCSNSITSISFDTIASTFSFWYRDANNGSTGLGSVQSVFSITVNGVQTFPAMSGTIQQYTVTLDPNKVNRVKLMSSGVNNDFIAIDDFTVTYTSKNAAQALYKVPENSAYLQSTTNGNKIIGNISNLDNITSVKAVGFMPLASESVSAVTSSYKLIANNGGSDTEIGTTQSVTGTTTVRGLQVFDVNPLTSAAWTASDFNALKAGVINKT
jgi:hypothetical protein